MRLEWTFRVAGEPVVVLERRAWHRVTAEDVTAWLERPDTRGQALDMFLGTAGDVSSEPFGLGARVASHLTRAFDRGGLVALRAPRTTPPLAATVEAEEAPAPRRPAPTAAPTTQPTWIEIVLLDKDGQPVEGEPYSLVLPDGTQIEGRLDVNGTARVDGIEPGTCQVSFPRLGEGRR